MIDIYKISEFESDDRFKGLTQANKIVKKIGLKYAYQIQNSPWFVFKNGETMDELCFFDASSGKFYTIDEFILSYSVPKDIRSLMTFFFVKFSGQDGPVDG